MNTLPDPQTSVRVLVVDDQHLIRNGIASLLSIQEGIEVVGTAANGQEALAQARALHPNVVLMDVRMPVMDGIAATMQLRHELPTCQVLMLTTFDDNEYIAAALRAGAVGYLLKDLPDDDLARAIHAAHRRIYQFDPAVAQKLVSSFTRHDQERLPVASKTHPDDLSEREIDVVRQIARGSSNREIAQHLMISEGTVKSHISNILSRLGLRDRTQVAIYARDQGLLP
jgi:DNA-binding NarL/FixJ family response regulator